MNSAAEHDKLTGDQTPKSAAAYLAMSLNEVLNDIRVTDVSID